MDKLTKWSQVNGWQTRLFFFHFIFPFLSSLTMMTSSGSVEQQGNRDGRAKGSGLGIDKGH